MQPLFTVHGGEYLVGSYIEQHFKRLNVWIPSRDTGVDLLVTDRENRRMLSLQVKFSKDYLFTHMPPEFRKKLRTCGWYRISRNKLKRRKSSAKYWVFVLMGFKNQSEDFVIVPTKDSMKSLMSIHGSRSKKEIQCYLWVTESDRCWETRKLKIAERRRIANGVYRNAKYDFTRWLNKRGWRPLAELNQ